MFALMPNGDALFCGDPAYPVPMIDPLVSSAMVRRSTRYGLSLPIPTITPLTTVLKLYIYCICFAQALGNGDLVAIPAK